MTTSSCSFIGKWKDDTTTDIGALGTDILMSYISEGDNGQYILTGNVGDHKYPHPMILAVSPMVAGVFQLLTGNCYDTTSNKTSQYFFSATFFMVDNNEVLTTFSSKSSCDLTLENGSVGISQSGNTFVSSIGRPKKEI